MASLLDKLLDFLTSKLPQPSAEQLSKNVTIDWGPPTGNKVVNQIGQAAKTSSNIVNKPSPTPPPADAYRQGFAKYGSPLLAQNADAYYQAQQKYPLADPYLLAVASLMETGGGKQMKYKNNPINWGMQDMESIPYTIDRASSGIGGRFPYYKDYLKSGDIADFFKVYTPESDPSNPTNKQLVERYNQLRTYFP